MWKLEENSLSNEKLLVNESLFALGNGYLGVRGCFEEGYAEEYESIRGTYINGFYEVVDVAYSEKLFGFPEIQEKLPNVMDAQTIEIYLDDEKISLFNNQHANYSRMIYFDKGYSRRRFEYKTKTGKKAMITFVRMVSLDYEELFTINVEVEYEGDIKIVSKLDGDVKNFTDKKDPRVSRSHSKLLEIKKAEVINQIMQMSLEAKRANQSVSCAVHHVTEGANSKEYLKTKTTLLEGIFEASGKINLTKYILYKTSKDTNDSYEFCKKNILGYSQKSMGEMLERQEKKMTEFWEKSDISLSNNERMQQGIRFSLFQLMQSVGRNGRTNIAAKGLSGEGYEGHTFWDTEIYVLPLFQLTQPDLAKNLLMYRYHSLDNARKRARVLGHEKGVKFPWRTIDGIENSAYFPAGTAQYHINADIAYSFVQYYLYNRDLNFMKEYGAEVLFETARLWLEIGHEHEGKFLIHDVTGPDEYTCIVNNNFYTNVLAKYNMIWAKKIYDLLKEYDLNALKILMKCINMDENEFDEMERMAEIMYLPYDDKLKIHMQDDSFLSKPIWPFELTPAENYPLLLHYHPLTIYRYQVTKQADTILAYMLLDELFDEGDIRRSYDYYEKLTTHDSSLSTCVYGIMASRCGYYQKAYEYFLETVRLDLDDTHGNTKDGLHIANLAGSVLSIVFGFGGYRISEEGISIKPWIPKEWKSYKFKICYLNRVIEILVSNKIELTLLEGEKVDIKVYGKKIILNESISLPLEER